MFYYINVWNNKILCCCLMSKKYIYKICPLSYWKKALQKGVFKGCGIDIRDNFIHFSSSYQVRETLNKYFKKYTKLCLIEIDKDKINIKWEKSRNGHLFPHLYGSFNTNLVNKVVRIKIDINGNYILPSLQ